MKKRDDVGSIVERIKARRAELGLSYQELAEKTGLSKSTLQRYETGDIANIPLNKIGVLAKGLNTSPEFIMGLNEQQSQDYSLDNVYFSFAKEAQENDIDPEDIKLAIETIKNIRNK